jgi:hypothetical protein
MDFATTGVRNNPLEYIIYLWDANHKEASFNKFRTKTFFEAYTENDTWIKTTSGAYSTLAGEAAHSKVQYELEYFKGRAEYLIAQSKRFPQEVINFDLPSAEVAAASKKIIELPFEIYNPVKPDPQRCMDAVRAMCKAN